MAIIANTSEFLHQTCFDPGTNRLCRTHYPLSHWGSLPLAALLPLIFGGISAAGGVGSLIENSVSAANQKAKNDLEIEEQRQHNEAVEKGLGSEVFLNPYKGKALKEILVPVIDKIDGVEQEGKKQIKSVIKSLKPFFLSFKIYEVKDGSGIFLKP